MKINNSSSLLNSYDLQSLNDNSTPKENEKSQNKLSSSALAHFQVDDLQISSINGDKMEEAVAGLRNISLSLKDILNRNTQIADGTKTYSQSEIKTELQKANNISSVHNYDILSSKAAALLA